MSMITKFGHEIKRSPHFVSENYLPDMGTKCLSMLFRFRFLVALDDKGGLLFIYRAPAFYNELPLAVERSTFS